MEIHKDVKLAPYTTLKIGGSADHLAICETLEEVVAVAQDVRVKELPLVVLAGGTNALIADEGIRGVVLLMRVRGIERKGETLRVYAGTPMALLVAQSISEGLSGLSWAGGLPGTVGGAVFGNAGTFGHAIGDSVESVEVLDERGERRSISKNDCGFGYRTSVFKEEHSNWVILSVTILLKLGDTALLRKEMMDAVSFRNAHHPAPSSAGSFFKNPLLTKGAHIPAESEQLKKWFERVPAGWLIDCAGLKGERVGGAKISEMHANFVVNAGDATEKDIRALAKKIKDAVREKFGVELEEEVRMLPAP